MAGSNMGPAIFFVSLKIIFCVFVDATVVSSQTIVLIIILRILRAIKPN